MNARIDRLIQASSRQIDSTCNRTFYPWSGTRHFDWPINYSGSGGRPWQIWLNADELISVTAVSSGNVAIPVGSVYLEPANSGPPYSRLEVALASGASFSGASTWQRGVAVTGLYGYDNDEVAAGAIVGAMTSSQTAVTVTSSSMLSAGALIRVDNERMLVTDTAMVTTGVTFTGPITASAADVSLDVGGPASGFTVDETIMLDAERMLVVDIAGTRLVVKRAWDGSVLAAHSNALIYAARSLSLIRGYLGTTAASHLTGIPVQLHVPPAQAEQACVGLTLYGLITEHGGMRATPITPLGSDRSASVKRTSSPVDALLDELYSALGRKGRTRVI
jgi:hypothetical protein